MQIGGYGGAAGAAREENEENAAPQAPPGARTRATPQRYVLLCYVLPCSVLYCSVLLHPVLSCSVLFWASLTNPSRHHHNTTQLNPVGTKNAIWHRGRRGKVGKPAPKAPGELISRRRRRRENEKSAPKAPRFFWILTSESGEIWANPGAQAENAGAQAQARPG
eukprot:gene24346-biopygen7391